MVTFESLRFVTIFENFEENITDTGIHEVESKNLYFLCHFPHVAFLRELIKWF